MLRCTRKSVVKSDLDYKYGDTRPKLPKHDSENIGSTKYENENTPPPLPEHLDKKYHWDGVPGRDNSGCKGILL